MRRSAACARTHAHSRTSSHGCDFGRTAHAVIRAAPSWVGRKPDHGEAAFGGQLHRQWVRISTCVADLLDAGVHDHLYANQAGLVGTVDYRARDLDAVVGGLDDGV